MRNVFLALLARSPAHGYELKQAFEAATGGIWPELNAGQIYTTLGRLERDGLVRRGGDPGDARAVLVTITPEGLARLLRIREARAAAIEDRLAELDPDEREALSAALPALGKLARELRP